MYRFSAAFLLVFSFLLLSNRALAYDPGWELIRNNDHAKAWRVMENTLQEYPDNENALLGMIFLAELIEDEFTAKRYIQQLIKYHPKPTYLRLFYRYYTGDPMDVINDEQLDFAYRIPYFIRSVDSLIINQRIDAAQNRRISTFNNFNWTVIGPFKNSNGYGHVQEFGPEKDSLITKTFYPSGFYDQQLQWVERGELNEYDIVEFGENLPVSYGSATYYASTFVSIEEAKNYQLRLARNCPIKVWVNGEMVFENAENRHFVFDDEIIELDMDEGIHRILVKCSALPEAYQDFLRYSREILTGRSSIEIDRNTNKADFLKFLGDLGEKFALRITDDLGNKHQLNSFFQKKPETPDCAVTSTNPAPWYDRFLLDCKSIDKTANHYLLSKLALHSGNLGKGYETIRQEYLQYKNTTAYKYFYGALLAADQQLKRAHSMFSKSDIAYSPVLDVQVHRLNEYDKKKYPELYIELLEELLYLFPHSERLIKNKIDFLDEHGEVFAKSQFVAKWRAEYPQTKTYIDKYTDDGSQSVVKDLNKANQRKASRFILSDYVYLIEQNKEQSQDSEVLKLYDELKVKIPYAINFRIEKAQYLAEQKNFPDAYREIEELQALAPYEIDAFELLGDLFESKNKKEALKYYETANDWAYALGYTDDLTRIGAKLEKLGEQSYNIEDFIAHQPVKSILKDTLVTECDPNVGALVLSYTKDVMLERSGAADIMESYVIMINNEAGAEMWNEGEFGFLIKGEKVKVVKSDGRELEYEVFDGMVNFNNQVQVGDLLYASTTYSTSPRQDMNGGWSHRPTLAFNDPVVYANARYIIPAGMKIGTRFYKLTPVKSIGRKHGYKAYDWSFRDIPRYQPEEATLNQLASFPHFMVCNLTDWRPLKQWFAANTYLASKADGDIKDKADDIWTKSGDTLNYVDLCYEFIQKDIKLIDGVKLWQVNSTPKNAVITYNSALGNHLDKTVLLKSFLDLKGIASEYVLVTSASTGTYKPIPNANFDYVILRYFVKNQWHYIDPSNLLCAPNNINETDADAWALAVNDSDEGVFRLPNDYLDPVKNKATIFSAVEFKKDFTLSAEVTVESNGVNAAFMRQIIRQANEEEFRIFLSKYYGNGSLKSYTIPSISIENARNIFKPLEMSFTIDDDDFFSVANKFVMARVPFMNSVTWSPHFEDTDRQQMFNLAQIVNLEPVTETIEIQLGKGMTLPSVPDNKKLDNRFFSYEISYSLQGKKLVVTKKQRFKTIVVQPEDWEEFKELYTEMISLDNYQLTIQRK